MTIIRCPHDDDAHPYVRVARPTAQNKALSYEALGMLTYLLSQTDDWVVVVDDLIRAGCRRNRVYSLLKELREAGHLVHERVGAGQHKPPVWAERTVYEQPLTDFTYSPNSGLGEAIPPVHEIQDLVNTSEIPPNPENADTVNTSATHAGVDAGKDKSLKTNALEQVQEQKDKSGGGDNADARAKVFDQYTALTRHGIDSLIVSQQLLADVDDYSQAWVDEAVSIAALNGVTNWNYVRKMLQAWKRDGREVSRPATVKGKFSNGNGAHAPPVPAVASTSEGFIGLKRKAEREAKQHGSS